MTKRGKKTILFICTGNTCRSPLAAGFFQKLLDERNIKSLEVKTAGVMTVAGLLPSQETVQLLDEVGVDIRKHRSTPLTTELIRKVDMIFGFTPFHVQSAIRMNDEARGKTFLLKEYVGGDPRRSRIQDPMGCTLEVFRKVFNEIMKACEKLVEMESVVGEQAAKKTTKKREKKTAKSVQKKTKKKQYDKKPVTKKARHEDKKTKVKKRGKKS